MLYAYQSKLNIKVKMTNKRIEYQLTSLIADKPKSYCILKHEVHGQRN